MLQAGDRCLRKLREASGKTLSEGMAKQLEELEMPKAAFSVHLVPKPPHVFDDAGCDEVEFLFTANPGEPLKPLSRIASGGEMSRVMLAIKTMLADVDRVQTLVFDEIDAGVGGKAAQKVGEKLASMGRSRQVLCVTPSCANRESGGTPPSNRQGAGKWPDPYPHCPARRQEQGRRGHAAAVRRASNGNGAGTGQGVACARRGSQNGRVWKERTWNG